MKRQVSLLATSDSGFKITLNQQNQDLDQLFSQFKKNLSSLPTPKNNENKNFLTTTALTERKMPKSKSKDKKRMKLIDYIYIKNTAKKNQYSSKINKDGMSANELRKSRMKEGKQKAFRSIVDQMVFELKQISAKALAMADLANQNLTYSGNTDDIAKLCNIRRILKDNIVNNMGQIQKLMGVEAGTLEARSRQKIQEDEDIELNNKLMRLQAIGVTRLESEKECLRPNNGLKIQQKNSNKDTWISERLDERDDP